MSRRTFEWSFAWVLPLLVVIQGCGRQDDSGDSSLNERARGQQCAYSPTVSSAIDERTAGRQWVTYSEGRGPRGHEGHTIERHVGRDINYLRSRDIAKASTFPDLDSAETLVDSVITAHRQEIGSWLATESTPQFQLSGHCPEGCGETLERGAEETYPTFEAVFFLARECKAPTSKATPPGEAPTPRRA